LGGHTSPGAFDDPSQIQAARQYLTDARQLLESSERAQEFHDGMLALHPNRLNPIHTLGGVQGIRSVPSPATLESVG